MTHRIRLELERGAAHRARAPRSRPSPRAPNDERDIPALSDDPAARRRELLVVLALCEARAKGARERAAPERTLALMRDGSLAIGTSCARLGGTSQPRPGDV
ncbi:MAG: hypothetical protein ACJ79K_10975 [Gemmatimonadaceae bacterium]